MYITGTHGITGLLTDHMLTLTEWSPVQPRAHGASKLSYEGLSTAECDHFSSFVSTFRLKEFSCFIH